MANQTKVLIKYLNALRDRTGRREEQVDFPPEATLGDVAAWLKARYGVAAPGPLILATLNGKGWGQFPSSLATRIGDGDVICLFPPIAGGVSNVTLRSVVCDEGSRV